MGEKEQVQRNYKDTVFHMLFNDKEKLLEIYNGLNGTNYTNVDDLRVNTLENAVYMNMKNDVSYVFRYELNIYEHQSSINPNMPLRNLFYVSRLLEAEVIRIGKKRSMYGSKLVKIPTPRFVVFYNGEKETEERFEYKLSDAYIVGTDEPELELKVTVLNINPGNNEKLLEQCKTLKEYSQYVSIVRENLLHMDIDEAVENAVNYCIRNNILAEFLRRNKAEVMKVAIFECNVEEEMKKIGNDYFEDGFVKGIQQGLEEGKLITIVSLYSKGTITKAKALEELGITEEEFINALKKYQN